MKKDSRLGIRINQKEKEKFYKLCESHGLTPSLLIERWIYRFIQLSKKNKIDFREVYSASAEKMVEYEEYLKS